MATSGTTAFNLDLNQIVEEAFERCGSEMRTGYDLRTARRSLNLLTAEWSNRGVNLWTIDEGTVSLTEDTITYNLPADTIDLLEQVIRTGTGTSQQDINITRISASSYGVIPNKNTTGRPNQVWINRQVTQPTINVWPAPEDNTYTFVYWALKRIEDAGTGVTNQDIPFRFLPCLVAGLAFYLSLKITQAGDRTQFLKQEYEEQWALASTEDRDKTNLRLVPKRQSI